MSIASRVRMFVEDRKSLIYGAVVSFFGRLIQENDRNDDARKVLLFTEFIWQKTGSHELKSGSLVCYRSVMER